MLSTRAALWRDRSLRFATGGGATVVGAFFGALRNKWLAEHLSTSGLGVLAQILSAQTWLGTAAGLGLALPMARAVGAASAAGDPATVRRTVWTALALIGAVVATVALLGLLLAPWLSLLLLGTPEYAGLVRIAMLGVAGLALYVVAGGVFAGRSDVGAPLVVALAGGAVATAVTVALVPRAGLTGGAIGAALLLPVGLAAACAWRRRVASEILVPVPRPRFDPVIATTLLRVGLAALCLALLDQGTVLALRAHYLRVNGVAANGLLQAALALAQQTSGVFMVYLSGYAFGRISGATDAAAVRDYTRRLWAPLVSLAVVAFALAMVVASPLLQLFYSDRFEPARPLMAWALFGEFCRVMTQVWALGALPLGGLRLWLLIGFPLPASLALAYLLLAPSAGALAVPLASAVSGLAQLAVTALLMSRRGVTPRPRDAALLATALAGLAWLARTVAG